MESSNHEQIKKGNVRALLACFTAILTFPASGSLFFVVLTTLLLQILPEFFYFSKKPFAFGAGGFFAAGRIKLGE